MLLGAQDTVDDRGTVGAIDLSMQRLSGAAIDSDDRNDPGRSLLHLPANIVVLWKRRQVGRWDDHILTCTGDGVVGLVRPFPESRSQQLAGSLRLHESDNADAAKINARLEF